MAGRDYVDTDALKKALDGREEGVLASIGIDWQRGKPHISCPYPDHDDKHPSWRWSVADRRAFCTCVPGGADDILSIVKKTRDCDFIEAKLLAARAVAPQLIEKHPSSPVTASGADEATQAIPAITEGREGGGTPPPRPRYSWSRLDAALDAYNGWPRAVDNAEALAVLVEEYGLNRETVSASDWRLYDAAGGGVGIVYLAIGPAGEHMLKYRSLGRGAKGKRTNRVLYRERGPEAEAGSPAIFFGQPCFWDDLPNKAALVITAGEEKAAAAFQAGYNALSPVLGEARLSEAWCEWAKSRKFSRIILAYDHDDAGDCATNETIDAFVKIGFSRTRLSRLIWNAQAAKGYDLNSVLKDGDDLTELLASAKPIRQGQTLWGLDEIAAYVPDPGDNLLGDMMLVKGQPMAMIGPPGAGKSRLTRWLAIAAITGRPWCGLKTNCYGSRWLLIQNEDHPTRVRLDVLPMVKGMDRTERDLVAANMRTLMPLNSEDMMLNMGVPGVIDRLKESVREFEPDVVVFDPLSNLFTGESENSMVDMMATVSMLSDIMCACNRRTAGIIIHHAQPGKESLMRAAGWDKGQFGRGSTSLYATVRSQVNVAEGSQEMGGPLVIICGKNNNGGKPFESRAVRLDGKSMRYVVDPGFDLDDYEEEMGRKKKSRSKRTEDSPRGGASGGLGATDDNLVPISSVVLALAERGGRCGITELIGEITSLYPVSPSTARRRVLELVKRKKIASEEFGTGSKRRIIIKLGDE